MHCANLMHFGLVCSANVILSGNTPDSGEGTWMLVSGSGAITDPGSPTSEVTDLGVGPNVFRWTISSGVCDVSTSDVTITRDNIPPIITSCPVNITRTAMIGSSSAVVSYPAAAATDNCGAPTITYSNASGSSFNVGTTTVTVTATDDSLNTATCSFTVTVLTPQQAAQNIKNMVNSLVTQGVLNAGQGRSLLSTLDGAIRKMDNGKANQAINKLNEFINQVGDFIADGTLTQAQGQPLIDAANNLISDIS
jgi:hypothetical protein